MPKRNATFSSDISKCGKHVLPPRIDSPVRRWFCSAPMSDGFLVLAQIQNEETSSSSSTSVPSCFFVPRWLPNGERNPFYIQRLKDKLGNRSNASGEIELNNTHGVKPVIGLLSALARTLNSSGSWGENMMEWKWSSKWFKALAWIVLYPVRPWSDKRWFR